MPIDSARSHSGATADTQQARHTADAANPSASPVFRRANPIDHPSSRTTALTQPIEQPNQKRQIDTADLQETMQQPTVKRLKKDGPCAPLNMRDLFETHLPAARQIIDYCLHLNTQRSNQTEAINNQELMRTVTGLFDKAKINDGQDVAKIQAYLHTMQPLLHSLEQKEASHDTARQKLHWFLEHASRELDTTTYTIGNRDMLITDGLFSGSLPQHEKEMISAKSKLALAFALRQLPLVNWNEQPGTFFDRHPSTQAQCLEKIVSLKTILNNKDVLLEDDLNNLITMADQIHAPTLAQQETLTAQHDNAMQQFMQNMQQALGAFAAGQAGAVNPFQIQALWGQMPHQTQASAQDYQTKMRCYTAAAGALIKFGDTEQQQTKAQTLISKVKGLFEASKQLVYNFNHENSTRTGVLMSQAQDRQIAHEHDTILCKALCVDIAAGNVTSAFDYLTTAFEPTARHAELLLNLIDVAKTNQSMASPEQQARIFSRPLSQLNHRIIQDESMPPITKSKALSYCAQAQYAMGLNKEAQNTFDQSINYLTENNILLTEENHSLEDILNWDNGKDDVKTLMSHLKQYDFADKIRPMIDRQPRSMQPELLAHACELMHPTVMFANNEQPSDTVRATWNEAKALAMNLTSLPRKVEALLHLSDTRYAAIHQPNESEQTIASVRAMNDGSEAFRQAFQPFVYRVGPLNN